MNFKEKLRRSKLVASLHRYTYSFPLTNINQKEYTKRALLSYSIFPFVKKSRYKIHPNYVEVHELNNSLNSFGYNVDVFNNTYNRKIDYSKYDLIVGEGLPISNYFTSGCKKKVMTIYYATGCHPLYQNSLSINSLVKFYKKSGLWLYNSSRIVDQKWIIGASLSDFCIIIGNEVTKKTFSPYYDLDRIFTLYPPFYRSKIDICFEYKDPKKYLWFGSYGLIHKGLDNVIEAFLTRTDLTLYICGYLDREREVLDFYKERIEMSGNIHIKGFINIESNEFSQLMQSCSFSILTSVAEGMSTAIITVMGNGGLIPIITKETGIDIEYGIAVSYNSVDSILQALEIADSYSVMDIKNKAIANQQTSLKNSEPSEFAMNIKNIFSTILGSVK